MIPEQPPDLNKYTLIKEIGRGSFSTVYLACPSSNSLPSEEELENIINGPPDLEQHHLVAIKVIHRKKITKRLEFHLKQEILILQNLNNHPNIITLHEMIKCKEVICLVMEWCPSGDLAALIKSNKKKNPQANSISEDHEQQVKSIVIQLGKYKPSACTIFYSYFPVASALECLRQRELIHRDIKPQNLLLQRSSPSNNKSNNNDNDTQNEDDGDLNFSNFTLKIADFGFARQIQINDMAETLCGSPLYMAPEILKNEKYDAKADLWSVGCIMYELLFRKGPPFKATNHIILVKKYEVPNAVESLLDKVSGQMSSISAESQSLLRGLLKIDPIERISFEEFFLHDWLQRYIHGSRTSADEMAIAKEERTSHKDEKSPHNQSTDTTGVEISSSLDAENPPSSFGKKEFPNTFPDPQWTFSHLLNIRQIDIKNKATHTSNSQPEKKAITISSSIAPTIYPSFLLNEEVLMKITNIITGIFAPKMNDTGTENDRSRCEPHISSDCGVVAILEDVFVMIIDALNVLEMVIQVSALMSYRDSFNRSKQTFADLLRRNHRIEQNLITLRAVQNSGCTDVCGSGYYGDADTIGHCHQVLQSVSYHQKRTTNGPLSPRKTPDDWERWLWDSLNL